MTSEDRLRRMLERHDLHVRVFDAGSELVAPIEADAIRDVLARLKAAEEEVATWIHTVMEDAHTMDQCRAAARANIASRAKLMEGGNK
jgi:vacuolar-type H+-ATPase subunit E/Vma4